MKESYGKGLAGHTGPESCLADPRGRGEALTGENTGGLLSSDTEGATKCNHFISNADLVDCTGRQHQA